MCVVCAPCGISPSDPSLTAVFVPNSSELNRALCSHSLVCFHSLTVWGNGRPQRHAHSESDKGRHQNKKTLYNFQLYPLAPELPFFPGLRPTETKNFRRPNDW
ncbi:UNVERIFIED_CONTAM: hypothetical protein K2H54_013028 [Gekko kuhli]